MELFFQLQFFIGYFTLPHEKSTIFNVGHTFLYSLCLKSSLDARLTFWFNTFFLMEIPRLSSPLMLLAPLPRIQLFLFFLAVPAYDISLSPFCSGFQHNTIPLSFGISIQQNQQKISPHLGVIDNKKTDNEFFPHYQSIFSSNTYLNLHSFILVFPI